jgi:hypothetical protein
MKFNIITPAYLNRWLVHVELVKGITEDARDEYRRILQQQADLAGFVKES